MHDRLDHHRMNDDMNNEASLAAALRALPANTPPHDGWPALSAKLRRRRALRRTVWFTLPAALAACLALALAWPHVNLRKPLSAPVRIAQPAASGAKAPRVATPAADIAALQASSAQWQTWVRKLDRAGAPLDGRALAAAVTLQDRIALVDLQLSAARNPATVASLWQQRITLLQQMGLLHLQPYMVAEQAQPTRAHTTLM
jgi:hypothetical protein